MHLLKSFVESEPEYLTSCKKTKLFDPTRYSLFAFRQGWVCITSDKLSTNSRGMMSLLCPYCSCSSLKHLLLTARVCVCRGEVMVNRFPVWPGRLFYDFFPSPQCQVYLLWSAYVVDSVFIRSIQLAVSVLAELLWMFKTCLYFSANSGLSH